MIIINNNSGNTIYLSSNNLNDYIDNFGDGYFTLDLKNEYTNEEFNDIILDDISENPERYRTFILNLTTKNLEDFDNAYIYLKDSGFYIYTFNYIVNDEKYKIEEGYMKVVDNDLDDYFELENEKDNYFSI